MNLKNQSLQTMISCDSNRFLKINFSQVLGYPCSITVAPWNKGISWSKMSDEGMQEHSYHEELSVPFQLIQHDKNAQLWVQAIPSEICDALIAFEKRYKGVLSSALWFISRYRKAYEYFLHQPRLVWFLLYHAKKNRWEESYVSHLFSQKRINILAACNLPAKKSALNFLSKLSFRLYGSQQYNCINLILNTPNYSKLNHLQFLDEEMINFIKSFPLMLSSRLVKKYDGQWNWPQLRETVTDTKRMADIMIIDDIFHQMGRCRNLSELRRLHDRLAEKLNKENINKLPDIQYPAPPVKGTKFIIPIKCMKELAHEAQIQHHCVKSYHERIIRKQYFIYKILSPERATVGLRMSSNKGWVIDQVKLKCNNQPSNLTQKAVIRWFFKP